MKLNDYDKLKNTFDEIGIPYYVKEYENKIVIRIKEGKLEKVEGYSHFYVDFTFDKEGNYIVVGVWE